MANAALTSSKSTLFSHYYIHLTLLQQFEEIVPKTLCSKNVDLKILEALYVCVLQWRHIAD